MRHMTRSWTGARIYLSTHNRPSHDDIWRAGIDLYRRTQNAGRRLYKKEEDRSEVVVARPADVD